jgi:hypothetical protein
VKPIGSPVGAIDLRESTGGFTLGGLATTLDAEVLHVSGEPIPGLFALVVRPPDWPRGVTPAASRSVTVAFTAAARVGQRLVLSESSFWWRACPPRLRKPPPEVVATRPD